MGKTDNEILKKTLRHYIDLEYYANGVTEDLDEILEELYEKCGNAILANEYLKTKADYNAVHSVLEDYLSDFQSGMNDRLEKEAETVKENERDFLSALYGTALTVGAVSLAKILFTPFDGRDTVKTFSERAAKNIRRTYDTALRSGYMFGQKSSDVKEQADKNLRQITRGINNGVITAIPSFAKNTDRMIFMQNSLEVVWVATLDGRTCITCASMSGLHFKSISLAPQIPHVMCRCILYPVDKITEPIPTYEEFIESLSEEDQLSVLGKNRFEMWKQYDIPLERFVNNGSVVPVNKLKEELSEIMSQTKQLSQNEKTAELVRKVSVQQKVGHSKILREELSSVLKPQYGTYKNAKTGIDAHLNGRSLKKLGSDKAIDKSKANGFTISEHFEAASRIIELYKNAELVEVAQDKKGSRNTLSIKRFNAVFTLRNGKTANAYITVKETEQNGHKIYSVELKE